MMLSEVSVRHVDRSVGVGSYMTLATNVSFRLFGSEACG